MTGSLPKTENKKRRAVAQSFTALRAWGRDEDAAVLKGAWQASSKGEDEPLTHAVHPYPGRMHWAIARQLMRHYGESGQRMLDPFVGGGTTMLEAMMAGLDPVGVDLNPLSIPIGKTKTRLTSERDRKEFLSACEVVAQKSEERVRARARAKIPISKVDASWYSPHVLFELSGLLEEIRNAPATWRTPMEVLFSALTTKFSLRKSETSPERQQKRIRKGLSTEFFLRRSKLLAKQWSELESLAKNQDKRWLKPTIVRGDARQLGRALGGRRREDVDLVVTSPPYAGTYDYFDHHRLRMAWLGLGAKRFGDNESGARRQMQNASVEQWRREFTDLLMAMQSVCRPGAPILLVLGDGRVAKTELSSVGEVQRTSKALGMQFVAAATVKRAILNTKKTRTEAIILLNA